MQQIGLEEETYENLRKMYNKSKSKSYRFVIVVIAKDRKEYRREHFKQVKGEKAIAFIDIIQSRKRKAERNTNRNDMEYFIHLIDTVGYIGLY